MRTLTLVLVSLLLVSVAFALESGPSNKVGYVKVYCGGYEDPPGTPQESYQQFGLPFRFWHVATSNVPLYDSLTTCPSDIIGLQANPGTADLADQIIRQDGDFAFRNASGVWTNFLQFDCSMEPATAYWFKNMRGYDINLILAGDADLNANNIPSRYISEPGSLDPLDESYVPYSWRDPRELSMIQLGLNEGPPAPNSGHFEGGSDISNSDWIVQQGLAGDFAWYKYTTTTWMGGMAVVVPGESYWISNKHPDNGWDYQFVPPGALLMQTSPAHTPSVISKFRHTVAKKVAPVKTHVME